MFILAGMPCFSLGLQMQNPSVKGEPASLLGASPIAPLCVPLLSHLFSLHFHFKQLHKDSSRINFDIVYLVIQSMYILYKYFHLAGAEHSLSKWETQKVLNTWLTASHLTLWFTKFPQSFCENFWPCIIHIVHCCLHKVVRDLPVLCGHRKVSQRTKWLLSGRPVTPSRALFFHLVQYCRCCPVQSHWT